MTNIIRAFIQLVAAVFLFFLIGLAIAILLIQNSWLDMRFDSEYMVTISLLTGLWFYFLTTFMNAKKFAIWESARISVVISILCMAVTAVITITGGSFSILPSYVVRKSLFLEEMLTLDGMNILLIILIPIGIAIMAFAVWSSKKTKTKTASKTGWNQLSRFQKFGMMSLYGLIALFLLVYLGQGDIRDLFNQASGYLKDADVEGFRDYLLSFGPLAAVVSGLLMVFQAIIAPLPAFVITFTNGLLFGWVWGAVLSWSSAMAGAVLCFYLAKMLGRPVVEKMVTKKALNWWDQFFEKYGKHAVFIARLVPIVSFDLVSYAAGVTSISFWQFFWATGIGQLPATILYSYLGQNATSTVKILFFIFTIVIALAVIGMILRPKLQARGKGKQGANG
ncbi:TVP38/TMEM64 family protein [Neobacillus novalis]|uniref:TVP38/TMEM64 family membrane protein n=1 Tax=Neobacillus novalis TaxID=220687 RepID=A0AA95MR04_9BACI|nr:TVP38/TMEM64 family protein [Neobacillus novalis]WHY87827.1 TVP38/TMEM64 family protein [Neobacillus novalis]